eukprot:g53935.t1
MDTPSDSDFDDYYDEVAQDLFSEEMESMQLVKKLEQERAIEKNGDAVVPPFPCIPSPPVSNATRVPFPYSPSSRYIAIIAVIK